ncbi:MAG: HAMP domain-containing histidine kinase [Actinomycetota bacterium]|nr:HAMP domain-containing histidine kinase [Actinomycetota bacterium]
MTEPADRGAMGGITPASPFSRPRWRRLLSLSRLDGVGRVWLLNSALVLSAASLFLGVTRGQPALGAPFHLPWFVLAAGFFLAEVFVVHIQFRGDAHSISLGEIPLVLGLFFASPASLVLAQVVGDTLALALHRRQSPVKLVFNVGHFALETCLAAILFHAVIGTGNPIGPAGWAATYVAVLACSVVGVLMIFAAISLSEGEAKFGILRDMLGMGTVVTLANASIALALVTVARIEPDASWTFLAPTVILFLGYRAYTSMAQRHRGLGFLYEAVRTFHQSPRPGGQAILELLSHTRGVFRAETAEVIFLPSAEHPEATRTRLGPGDERVVMEPFNLHEADAAVARAIEEERSILIQRSGGGRGKADALSSGEVRDGMIAPIPGQSGVVGAILISNRLGDVSTFDERDLQLLETLAEHLGVSLESARAGMLQAEVAELNEINQMKDDLIASTSHELRTPLTSILGFVKTLLRPEVELTLEEQRSFLETVARQSERLTRLVEDLLTASQLEAQRAGTIVAPVSPEALALRVLEDARPQAGGRSFELDLDVSIPLVETDGERVHQILLNLVVNAIKYSADGTTITIGAEARGTGAVLWVRDQGRGIPPELQSKIFDRLYQVDQSSTRSAGGIGLGLYISRKLADSLGGHLWLERSDDYGSVFSLQIPWTPPVRSAAYSQVVESAEAHTSTNTA